MGRFSGCCLPTRLSSNPQPPDFMANFNRVILAGNLTRDPELKYTSKGTAVARIGMAINRTWKNETGEQKEEVTFVDVDAWGRQAEVIAQDVKKGRPLLVEGRL